MGSSVPCIHGSTEKLRFSFTQKSKFKDLNCRKTTVLITQGLKDLFPCGPSFQQIN